MRAAFGLRRDPWSLAFAASALTFLASLALSSVALWRNDPDNAPRRTDSPSQAARPVASPEIAGADRLIVAGTIPSTIAHLQFATASTGQTPDVTFSTSDDAQRGVVTGYLVPVVAWFTGVDALTSPQLAGLLNGTILDWGDVGGVRGPVARAIRSADGTYTLFKPGISERTFQTSVEVLGAIGADSGTIALLPLESVRPSVMSVSVDGVDIVRGRGDAAQWPFVQRTIASASTKAGRDALAAMTAAMRAQPPRPVTVVATGDILQSRCSLTQIRATGDWGAALRGPVAAYLAAADLALGSLDGSIQDVSEPFGCIATTNLTSPPEVLEAFTIAGFDEMTVATNHVFDCGQAACGTKALLQTLKFLEGVGIKHVGGGANLEGALAPAIFEVRGVLIGVLGFDDVAAQDLEATDTSPGTAPLDDDYTEERAAGEPAFFRPASELSLVRFKERIARLKSEVDIVIVQVQSGTEDTHTPSSRSLKALRAAADSGADVVVGNQAHWVQAIETRGNAFITYALGNFIFDQVHTPEHTQGYLLETTFIDKRLVAVRFVPYQIEDRYRPVFATGVLRLKILGDVFKAAKALPERTP